MSPSCLQSSIPSCLAKPVPWARTWDPERESTWQRRGRKTGEAAGDTQKPASPQALCSVILQQLPSGSWTRATETFVVIIAPNTYLHLALLWAPNSEGSTLSVITRGPWGLRVGLRRAAGIKMMGTKHPAPSVPSKAFDKYLALGSQPPFVLLHCGQSPSYQTLLLLWSTPCQVPPWITSAFSSVSLLWSLPIRILGRPS